MAHSTKPLGMLRAAEPEPSRASADNFASVRLRPAALAAATVSAAKADADEAMPVPVGKLLRDSTRAHCASPAQARIASR